MATVDFDLRGAGKIPAEHAAIADAAEKATKKQEKLGQTYNLSAKEATKAARQLQDILKRNESDQDKYNRRLNETKKALAGTVKETELLAKETTKLRVELLKGQDANPKLAAQRKRDADAAIAEAKRESVERTRLGKQAAKELADFDRRYTTEHKQQTEQRIRDILKSERAHAKFLGTLRNELGKLPALVHPMTEAMGDWTEEGVSLGEAIDDVGESIEDAFGATAVQSLSQMALQMGALLGPVGLLKKGFDAVNESREKASGSNKESRNGIGLLKQLTGDQGQLAEYEKFADSLFARGAVGSKNEALLQIYDLAQARALDAESFGLLSQLGEKDVFQDLGKLVNAGRTQVSSFGRKETGSLGQIIGKALAAGDVGASSPDALLTSASNSAAAAKIAGLTDEENLAAVTTLGTSLGSDDEASTVYNSLLFSLSDIENKLNDQAADKDQERLKVEQIKVQIRRAERSAERFNAKGQAQRTESIGKAKTRLSRAEEDRRFAKTPAARRSADRRIDDAKKALADVEAAPDQGSHDERIADLRGELTLAEQAAAAGPPIALPDNFGSLNFVDKITAIDKLKLSPAALLNLLGRKEAVKAQAGLAEALNPNAEVSYPAILTSIQAGNINYAEAIQGRLNLKHAPTDAARLRQQQEAAEVLLYETEGGFNDLSERIQSRQNLGRRQAFGETLGSGGGSNALSAITEGFATVTEDLYQTLRGPQAFINDVEKKGGLTAEESEILKGLREREANAAAALAEMKKTNELLGKINDKASEGGLVGTPE